MKVHLLLFTAFLFLNSCNQPYIVQKSYIEPRGRLGRACVEKCIKQRSSCKYQAIRRYENCLIEQNRVATKEYDEHLQRAMEQNNVPDKGKTIKSYLDEGNCYKYKRNNCQKEYDKCYVSCGGKVESKKVCSRGCSR